MQKISLISKEEFSTSNWGGGCTTQLFLYPAEASYAKRNFQLRLSTATVNQSPSTFTSLPGYRRILMPLNAPLKLAFTGQGEAELNPFEVAKFAGEWLTVSYGRCTDIGLMLADGWDGKMQAVSKSGQYQFTAGFTALYALNDEVKAFVLGQKYILEQGDLLLLEIDSLDNFKLIMPKENSVILVQMFKK
ncbi:MAG: HutD family protein [Spirochaetaceae bacterium]|nr:HutD family protein [Spirochaetaceae bacterium]